MLRRTVEREETIGEILAKWILGLNRQSGNFFAVGAGVSKMKIGWLCRLAINATRENVAQEILMKVVSPAEPSAVAERHQSNRDGDGDYLERQGFAGVYESIYIHT